VDQEHQAGLLQLPRHRQAFYRTEPGINERLLPVDLAAAAGKTGNPLGADGIHDPVATPAGLEHLRTDEDIILVAGMADLRRRDGDPQGRDV